METLSTPPELFSRFLTNSAKFGSTILTLMNGTWNTLDIAGKSADVYDLASGVKPRFGILFLHGSGLETLRDRTAFTRLFDELRLSCVCPAGGLCWWVDRICPAFDPERTPERHIVYHVLPFLAQLW